MKKLDANIALKRPAHGFRDALRRVGQTTPSEFPARMACGLARGPSVRSEAPS